MRIKVFIPAHRDTAGIKSLLASIQNQELASGRELDGIILACDESPKELLLFVENWAHINPSIPVSIRTSRPRSGKAGALRKYIAEIRGRESDDSVIVVCDEDVVLPPSSLAQLVEPFFGDHNLAVAWGVDVPTNVKWGSWASSFQIQFHSKLVCYPPRNSPRAYGRFFAFRISKLADFEWRDDEVDDTQLERFLLLKHAKCVTVPTAKVFVLPARQHRDFFLQTRRGQMARMKSSQLAQDEDSREINLSGRGRAPRFYVRALAATSIRYPHRSLAYAFARVATLRLQKKVEINAGPVWDQAESTKRRSSVENGD